MVTNTDSKCYLPQTLKKKIYVYDLPKEFNEIPRQNWYEMFYHAKWEDAGFAFGEVMEPESGLLFYLFFFCGFFFVLFLQRRVRTVLYFLQRLKKKSHNRNFYFILQPKGQHPNREHWWLCQKTINFEFLCLDLMYAGTTIAKLRNVCVFFFSFVSLYFTTIFFLFCVLLACIICTDYYFTHMHSLEIIFEKRIANTPEYVTKNPEEAILFYIPFPFALHFRYMHVRNWTLLLQTHHDLQNWLEV